MAQARKLSAEQQKEFFEILGDPHELTADTIVKLFAYSKKRKGIRFYPTDIITIQPEQSKFVKPNTVTTCGIYIVNKYLFEDVEIFGYINKTIDGGTNKKIDAQLSKAMMSGELTREQYGKYIDRAQWLYGGPLAFVISTSLSETLLTLPPTAKKQRAELLKAHKSEIEANDPQVSTHIEREVVSTALAEMRKKDDPAMALFDSGCGVDPYNQYKTIMVMKGAIADNTGESPTGYKIVTSNYDTGITPEDMPKIADTVVTSSYSSGVATQDSGTNGKKYNALFQRVRIQPRGTDCGSTDYLNIALTKDNASSFIWRYIKDGSKLVMLNPDNIDKYIGQTVKLRSCIHCKAKDPEYCSVCVGDRPYRVGIKNIGFTLMTVSGSTLNASLKKKHDVSIKLYNLGLDDVMKYVEEK